MAFSPNRRRSTRESFQVLSAIELPSFLSLFALFAQLARRDLRRVHKDRFPADGVALPRAFQPHHAHQGLRFDDDGAPTDESVSLEAKPRLALGERGHSCASALAMAARICCASGLLRHHWGSRLASAAAAILRAWYSSGAGAASWAARCALHSHGPTACL